MPIPTRKILGIAVEENSMCIAEVQASSRRPAVRRAARFAYPDGASLREPAALGQALRVFLRQQHFSARRVVVGLPARWLVTREERVPRADSRALAGMLRVKAGQAFSTPADDLALDYALGGASEQGMSALLVASPTAKVDQVVAAMRAARLRPLAVMPTTLALGAATTGQTASRLVLNVGHESVEFAFIADGRPRAVRALAVRSSGPGGEALSGAAQGRAIAASLAQAAALLPRDDAPEPRELVVWDGAGLGPEALSPLAEQMPGTTAIETDLTRLGMTSVRGESVGCAAAAALASTGRTETTVDFLHSRLTPPRQSVFGKRLAWAAALVIAFGAAGVSLYLDWRQDERDVAALKLRLERMQGDIDAARVVVKQVSQARSWYDQSPRFLEHLRQLTLTFPEAGTIWATSLAIREDREAVLSGRSDDEKAVLDVLARLKRSSAISDLKLLYVRETGGKTRGVSFAIRFTCAAGG